MNENGEISIEKDEKIESESLIWYVTMINNERTFFQIISILTWKKVT